MAWPAIQNQTGLKEKTIKMGITNTSAAGYTLSRARATGAKKVFELSWDMMTSADKATLSTYFDTNKGSDITWIHTDTLVSHTVVIMDDELEFVSVPMFVGYWSISITLKEI